MAGARNSDCIHIISLVQTIRNFEEIGPLGGDGTMKIEIADNGAYTL